MLVSIIIPCYNSEQYLRSTVSTVLNQSYKNFELILINDGSKDNTWDIIKELETIDSRVKGFSQENRGVSAARNYGIEVSNGKYLSFLDSDDTYEKDKILLQVQRLEETGAKICYCGNKYIFTDRNVEHVYKKEGKILNEYILNTLMIHLNDWMVEAELVRLNHLKFPEAFRYGEDVNFFMKVLALAEAVAVDKQLTNYFIRETSSSFNHSIRNNKEDNYINDFEKYLNENTKIIYNEKEKENIIKLLNTYLLPQVIIRNVIHCKKNYNDLSDFEKHRIENFKFSMVNFKSSVKFYYLYLKAKYIKWSKYN